jgi:hypothetical protein
VCSSDLDDDRLPPKSEMRASIRGRVDALESGDPDRPFRKAELEAIAAALGADE